MGIDYLQFQHHDVRDLEKIPAPHVASYLYDLDYPSFNIQTPSQLSRAHSTWGYSHSKYFLIATKSWRHEASSPRAARNVLCARLLPRLLDLALVPRSQRSEPQRHKSSLFCKPLFETAGSSM